MFIPHSRIKSVKRIAKSIIGLTATAAVLVYGTMLYQARAHEAQLKEAIRIAETDSIHAVHQAHIDSLMVDVAEVKRLTNLTLTKVNRLAKKVEVTTY